MEFLPKDIHIGKLISEVVEKKGIKIERISKFLEISEDDVLEVYDQKDIDSAQLLLWSKLLEYDFFRIYSQHLLLYSPPGAVNRKENTTSKSSVATFRKNIYTTEIISFVLDLVDNSGLTKSEISQRYNIPKTTLYKWIKKHKKI
ncbi:MAG TPA: helix-turn-helix domain-containing protein [Aequorivita sp.]|nr:helix-turn-helix domain-containing protein [Aequorivita sp.]